MDLEVLSDPTLNPGFSTYSEYDLHTLGNFNHLGLKLHTCKTGE